MRVQPTLIDRVTAHDAFTRGFHAGADLQGERRGITVDAACRTHYMRGFVRGRRAAEEAERAYWAELRDGTPAEAIQSGATS